MNISFYTPEGKVNEELYDKVAKEIAGGLISTETNQSGQPRPRGVTKSQLRRIYDEVKRLEKLLDQGRQWEDILPLVKMVKAKTAYATARMKANDRRNSKFFDHLDQFINGCVAEVKTQKDFKVFALLFEAVYGFYYGLGGVQTQ